MTITISVIRQLDDTWASPEELAEMSNEQILELVREDLFALHDGAVYQVDREQNGKKTQALYRIGENEICEILGEYPYR